MNNKSSHRHKKLEPVTLVFSSTVKKGKEKEFEQWAHKITDAVKHFEGHLGSNWIYTANNIYIVIVKFIDIEDSNRWLNSPVRKRLIQEVHPLIKEDKPNRLQNITGLETWFTLPGRVTMKPPPPMEDGYCNNDWNISNRTYLPSIFYPVF